MSCVTYIRPNIWGFVKFSRYREKEKKGWWLWLTRLSSGGREEEEELQEKSRSGRGRHRSSQRLSVRMDQRWEWAGESIHPSEALLKQKKHEEKDWCFFFPSRGRAREGDNHQSVQQEASRAQVHNETKPWNCRSIPRRSGGWAGRGKRRKQGQDWRVSYSQSHSPPALVRCLCTLLIVMESYGKANKRWQRSRNGALRMDDHYRLY